MAPSASIYSDDGDDDPHPRLIQHPDMPVIAPLRLQKKPSYHPSFHAHHDQQVRDKGPQVRQSRLPIFKQVRGLLHRPPPLDTTTRSVKYDEFSGDISDFGKAPDVRPSTYKNPYHGTFEARRELRSTREQQRSHSVRDTSPVSVLNDREIGQMSSPELGWDGDVSPVAETDEHPIQVLVPSQTSSNGVAVPLPATAPQFDIATVKRKPAPNRHSLSPENIPPQSSPPFQANDFAGSEELDQSTRSSHFSWTTCAPSVAPTRASIDTYATAPRHSDQFSERGWPVSRFSWSTSNTQMTNQLRFQSPPPSPPPAVPGKYRTPPVQSIMSRHRPIHRDERDEWTTPARKMSLPGSTVTSPTSTQWELTISTQPFGNNASGKKLPLPPQLLTPVSPMTHLEQLHMEEQDRIRQRRNLEHAIAELTTVEKASPLDVSYAQVKDAEKKLKDLRSTLAEVTFEEREIGIAISRARRKEGEEEGLWVRRVTG